TDGPPALALGVDPPDPGLMSRPPRDPSQSILSARNLLRLIMQGMMLTLGAVVAYLLAPRLGARTEDQIRTVVFSVMVLGQQFHAFNFRVGQRCYFSRTALENRYLVGAFLLAAMLQLALICTPVLDSIFKTIPLSGPLLLLVALCALGPALAINLIHLLPARRHQRITVNLPVRQPWRSVRHRK
ncbi:MAG: cation-translocating P-type ATPase C-terminal domain-containing protein, partial [candidate division WOR-3 bacterium]